MWIPNIPFPEFSVVVLFHHTGLGTKTRDPPLQKKNIGAALEGYSSGITIKIKFSVTIKGKRKRRFDRSSVIPKLNDEVKN